MNENYIEKLSADLMHYGEMTSDINFIDNNGNMVRCRTFKLNDKRYFHYMVNGKVIDCCKTNSDN